MKFTAAQVLHTFRDSREKTSKIRIIGGKLYSLTNFTFEEVAAGKVSEVIFSEEGNPLPAMEGREPMVAYNVENVTYTDRHKNIEEITDTKIQTQLKQVKKELEALP